LLVCHLPHADFLSCKHPKPTHEGAFDRVAVAGLPGVCTSDFRKPDGTYPLTILITMQRTFSHGTTYYNYSNHVTHAAALLTVKLMTAGRPGFFHVGHWLRPLQYIFRNLYHHCLSTVSQSICSGSLRPWRRVILPKRQHFPSLSCIPPVLASRPSADWAACLSANSP
jgi:hypothetical protein